MNKGDLIALVAQRLGCSKARAARAVQVVLDSITDGVADEGRVRLAHFGSFEKRERRARTVRNPGTGEPMTIPPRATVIFRPSDWMKQKVDFG